MPEKVTITKNKLDSLAEVIGSKSNQNVPLTIEGMEDAVLSLITPIDTKLITENGTYDVTNYANAKINVPDVFVITPTYAYNSNDGPTWTIDKTYDEVDAAYTAGKTVVVDATISYIDYSEYCVATFFMTQISSSQKNYTVRIGWYDDNDNLYHEQYYDTFSDNKTWNLDNWYEYDHPKSLTEKTITANGTYDPTKYINGEYANGYSKVTVNVPPTTLQSLTVTPSTEQQVFNASSQMGDTALMDGIYLWKNGLASFNIPLTIGTDYWLVLTRYTGSSGWNDSQINAVYGPVLWTATESYSYPFWQNDSSVRIRYDGATNTGNNWRYKITVYPVVSSTAYAPVTVEPIPSEYTVPTLQAKTNINPTTSSQTITADSGYDGLSSVQINAMPNGTAGTPAAIKGTVSNNSITVTPSVTNITGYITGGTKTGTAVTVSAFELVSGTYNITSSGTKDITNYKNVSISSGTATVSATKGTVSNNSITVTPSVTTTEGYINANTSTGTAVTISASELVSGSQTIVQNGTVDVTNLASVTVSVPTGGSITQDANGYLVLDDEGSSGYDTDFANTIMRSGIVTNIPSSVTSIGGYAFRGYTNLALTSLPSGITSIGTYAFYGCTNLALTELPSGLTSIGDYAFYNCTNLALTSLPSGVTSIGTDAFYSCTNITLTTLPNGVTSISAYAFNGCTNLALTSLPSGLTSINTYAFRGCTNLALTSLPSGITSIGTYAFYGCTNLALTELPSGLTSIYGNAFYNCSNITQMDLPNVGSIASSAFYGCSKLQTLVLRKSNAICTLSNVNAFGSTPLRGYNGLTGTVYVPQALISTYQTATNWSTLYNEGYMTFVAIEGSEYEQS